jgi:hypothetical protein
MSLKPGVVAYICNPSTWKAKAGKSQIHVSLGYITRSCLKKKKKPLSHHTIVSANYVKWGTVRKIGKSTYLSFCYLVTVIVNILLNSLPFLSPVYGSFFR